MALPLEQLQERIEYRFRDIRYLQRAVTHSSYSNETGAFEKTLLLRNITGLWLLQEVRRIWKLEGKKTEMNNCSAQFYIRYGERTLLMAADLEGEGQTKFVELKGDALRADVLKYPHHGLEKLRDAYMEAVSPAFMFVTNNLTENAGRAYIRNCGVPSGYTVPGFLYLATDGVTWVADRIPSEIKY